MGPREFYSFFTLHLLPPLPCFWQSYVGPSFSVLERVPNWEQNAFWDHRDLWTFSEKPTAGIDKKCEHANGLFPDTKQCDLYYECVEGVAKKQLCPGNNFFSTDLKILLISTYLDDGRLIVDLYLRTLLFGKPREAPEVHLRNSGLSYG